MAALTGTQLVKYTRGCETIGNSAGFCLEIANRAPGFDAKLAVWLADIVAMVCEQLLKFQSLRTRQYAFVPWPILYEGSPAA